MNKRLASSERGHINTDSRGSLADQEQEEVLAAEKDVVSREGGDIKPESSESQDFWRKATYEIGEIAAIIKTLADNVTLEGASSKLSREEIPEGSLRERIDSIITNIEGSLAKRDEYLGLADKIIRLIKSSAPEKQVDGQAGEPNSPADIEMVRTAVQEVTKLLRLAAEEQAQIRSLESEYTERCEAYRAFSLKESGFASESQLYDHIQSLKNESWRLAKEARELGHWRQGFGIFQRSKIAEKQGRIKLVDKEVRSRQEQLNNVYGANLPALPNSLHFRDAAVSVYTQNLVETTRAFVLSRYGQLLEEAEEQESSSDSLRPEQLESLSGDYATKIFLPALYKEMQRSISARQTTNDDWEAGAISKAVELLKKSASLKLGLQWYDSEEDRQKELAFDDELASLPFNLKYFVQKFLRLRKKTADEYFQDTLAFVGNLSANSSRTMVEQSYQESLAELELIPYQNQFALEREKKALDDKVSAGMMHNFLQDFDAERWRVFKQNESVQALLGQEKLEATDRYLADTFRDRLLNNNRSEMEDIRNEWALMSFPYPENIPLCILSSVRYGLNYERKRLLVEYISSCPKQELSGLLSQKIPGLAPLIKVIRENPETYFLEKLSDENGDSEDNGKVFRKFQQNLVELLSYYLSRLDLQPHGFTFDVLNKLYFTPKIDFSSLDKAMESILRAPSNLSSKLQVYENLLRRARVGDQSAIDLFLSSTEALTDSEKSALLPQAKEFFGVLIHQKNIKPEHVASLASFLKVSSQDLQLTIDFIKNIETIKYIGWGGVYDKNKFDTFLELARNPDIWPAIKELSAYGYEFTTFHAGELPQIAARKDEIIADINRIREHIPHFKYELIGYLVNDQETQATSTHFRFEPEDILAHLNLHAEASIETQTHWFNACRKFNAPAIIDNLNLPVCQRNFQNLESGERHQIIDQFIVVSPGKIVDKLQYLDLSEDQQTRLLDILNANGSYTLIASLFAHKQIIRKSTIILTLLMNHPRTIIDHGLSQRLSEAEYTPEVEERVRESLLAEAAPSEYNRYFRVLQEIIPLGKKLPVTPWGDMFRRLASLQAQSEREEYDPWRTDLDPLVSAAIKEGLLKRENAKDAEIIYSYVQEYGMYNLPTFLQWHAAIFRAKKIQDIPVELREEMSRTLQVKVDNLPNKGFITTEIRKFRERIQAELLADKIPLAIVDTKLGLELFSLLKGSTRWQRSDDLHDLLNSWSDVVENQPEIAQLPEGYREVSFAVPLNRRKKLDTSEEAELANRQASLLGNPELSTALAKLETAYSEAAQITSLSAWWQAKRAAVLEQIDGQISVISGKMAAAANEKAKADMDKQRSRWLASREAVESFILPDLRFSTTKISSAEEIELVNSLEKLVQVLPGKLAGRDQIVRTMSALHAFQVMQDGHREAVYAEIRRVSQNTPSKESLAAWRLHLSEYLGEHYLNPNQLESHIGHTPFLSDLLRELLIVWGAKDLKKNIIIQKDNEMRALESGSVEALNETAQISLVPARGILRIFSGDLGDACFTSKHANLARGEYPGLTSFIFVLDRNTKNERLAGSVLAIETTNPAGETVLLVRANNPQENLINKVESDVLIAKTLEEMQSLADRRGIKHVVVPRDQASSSCSNRGKVAEFYARNFRYKQAMALTDEPATNFNGYRNWDAASQNRTVKIN